ncbi:MAG: N-acetylmuramic acid 6-phosphate etherase [Candidatus Eremiobacteraeota bacterium]|nr:N-acetylmuramic acid 6-phosphate etherase [Candidatus Eremiobacteraeota bacterium]
MDERTPEPPLTEEINPSTVDLDLLDTHELLHRINDEDRRAAWAVERELDAIGTAVDSIVARLRAGGRLHYFGAGTSGRIAVTDAAEMPPTFSVAHDLVVAHLAGGARAMTAAVEGAEDDIEAARGEVRASRIGAGDAVVGVSASGSTPYVLGAIDAATAAGALTIGITNDARSPLARAVKIPIALLTGAEVISGSTRMKAASAQKMALATISTAVMVKLGHVHGNLMVGVKATNEKLRKRAVRMTALLAGVDATQAAGALDASGYDVKAAVVALQLRCTVEEAQAALRRSGGDLRKALGGKS